MEAMTFGRGALWLLFAALVAVSMSIDLGLFGAKTGTIGFKDALRRTAAWVLVAFALGAVIFASLGHERAAEFATCYVTEYALSVDNLFVFIVLFKFFGIGDELQHRVLFWGILGALVMRAGFILIGVELISRFEWTTYLLGGFLVITGLKLAFSHDKEFDPSKNPMLAFAKRFMRVTSEFDGQRFFTRRNAQLVATPLFLALLVVETTDVLFAVDSVPAALAISSDRFVLYSSNVMAICGLRSLYFAVAGLIGLFRFLQHGLALILVFIGAKMLLAHYYEISIPIALSVVLGILAGATVASILWRKSEDD
jgi:tellurite resistance protein TerC